MAELLTLLDRERQIQDTGGVPVEAGGVTTYGRFESWPDKENLGSEFVEMIICENSVVVVDGFLPGIGTDPVDGVFGVNESIVVDEYAWVVRGVTKVTPKGTKLRIWLGE